MRNDACLGPGTAVQFEYDHNGLRTKKIVTESGVTTVTEYRLHGSLVTHLTRGTDSLHFYYDVASRPAFVDYNGTMYAYVHNLQGDIVGILDSTGALVVTYSYDAWENPIQTGGTLANTLGKLNPFRYRGYVFDKETGLYYVSSRYYDPEICRWINADDAECLGAEGELLSYNLFAYCLNNPVNRTDVNGNWSCWATAGLIVGAVLCIAAVTVLTCGVGTATLAGAVAVGAAKGALVGAAAGTALGASVGFAITGTLEGAATGAAIGFGAGAVAGAAVAGVNYGTFSSPAKLTEHFARHGKEFGDLYSNVKEYAEGAKYVIKNGTYIPPKTPLLDLLAWRGRQIMLLLA